VPTLHNFHMDLRNVTCRTHHTNSVPHHLDSHQRKLNTDRLRRTEWIPPLLSAKGPKGVQHHRCICQWRQSCGYCLG
jgi:hypothetical protein